MFINNDNNNNTNYYYSTFIVLIAGIEIYLFIVEFVQFLFNLWRLLRDIEYGIDGSMYHQVQAAFHIFLFVLYICVYVYMGYDRYIFLMINK